MKYLIPILLLFASSHAQAQSKLSVGPVAGGNASGVNLHKADAANGPHLDFNSLLSWQAGLFVAYRASERSSFSIQPVFVRRRSSYATDFGTPHIRVDYLEIPVLYRYHISKKFFAEAGAYAGFRLDGRSFLNGEEIQSAFGTLTDWQADTDLGGILGIGYKISGPLHLSLRFAQGLADLYPDLQYTDNTGQPLRERPIYLNRSVSLQLSYDLLYR